MAMIGALPAGALVLGICTFARSVVIATTMGVYIVSGGKLKRLELRFA